MNSFLQRLEQNDNWKYFMRQSCKNNGLCTSLAGQLTPNKMKLLNQRFKKAYNQNQQSNCDFWIEHQMRAFNWILIAISALQNVKITDFQTEQWNIVNQIFEKKSPIFLRYQTRRFMLQKCTRNKNWTIDQNQLLNNIVTKQEHDKIPWNQVARKLFELSQQKYFRTSKHCRERWMNYLDPSITRGNWTKQDDIQLLDSVARVGKKWAELALLLKRTEHCVKNRFNSIIARQKKETPNFRKQDRLILEAKGNLLKVQPVEKPQSKLKIKPKLSSESMFDQNKSLNKEQMMTFQEVQPRNKMDYLHNYALEGGHFIEQFVREDDDIQNKQLPLFSNLFCSSPKNITPLGFSPSPFSMGYTQCYYYNNFTPFLQGKAERQDPEQNK